MSYFKLFIEAKSVKRRGSSFYNMVRIYCFTRTCRYGISIFVYTYLVSNLCCSVFCYVYLDIRLGQKKIRKLITMVYISSIWHKTIILPKFQLILHISRHSTPRLKIKKITKIWKFSYFLKFFSTSYETGKKQKLLLQTFVSWYKKSFATNFKQIAMLCGFAWIKFSALQTGEDVSALTELNA